MSTALAACAPENQPPPLSRPTSIADGRTASDALLQGMLSTDAPGCSAAVARLGEVVWSGARGLASANEPIVTATEFDIASVSKQFTATAVLLLARDGALSLDDRLSEHVTGLPRWAETVSLASLVNHTAGIPDYTSLLIDGGIALSDEATQDDALRAIAAVASLDEPGNFAYSNSHYVLLAEVIRSASGSPLDSFLADRVFGPLGLEMRVEPASTEAASGFTRLGNGWRGARSPWTQLGDGSVVTTPSELARWGDHYRTGSLGGGTDWIDDALELGAATSAGPIYGPGIELHPDGSLSHSGSWAGTVSQFEVSPDRETTVAVSCNFDGGPAAAIADDLSRVWFSLG